MSERETVTGPEPEPSALAWAERWLQSEQPEPAPVTPTMPGEPATRSLRSDADSTGVKTTAADVGPLRFDEYEVLEKIGEGGMGAVFQVRNLHLKRFEALKVITPRHSASATARVRFEREFQALGKIAHPNIVTVYHTGVWHGHAYFTMKYVPGGALSRHLDRLRADPAAVARLMAKVARAVQFLHREQVLHRDLKPHNILLGDGDEPLVADFGLVKHLDEDSDASVTGAPMGTRPYMSPEQTFAQKADYTPGCDIWAMGVILYELLAGRRPFDHRDPVDLYGLIRAAKPTPILEVNPAAPGPLAAIAHRCLQKSPADRYPTAAAVADDLEAWLCGEAVTATQPPAARAPRRRWALAALALGVVAALSLIAAVVLDRPRRDDTGGEKEPNGPTKVSGGNSDIAKQLREGKKVVLIGKTGLPVVDYKVPPKAALNEATEGCCTLYANELSLLDLTPGDLPLPVQVDAEVALIAAEPKSKTGGIFVGKRLWPGPMPQVSFVNVGLVVNNPLPQPREFGAYTFYGWMLAPGAADPPHGVPGAERRSIEKLLGFPFVRPSDVSKDPQGPVWHRVTIVVEPDTVRVKWANGPEQEVPGDELLKRGLPEQHFARPPGLVRGQSGPAFDGSIGLCTSPGSTAFRNVSLSPVPSPTR